jgi:hypothetical protein
MQFRAFGAALLRSMTPVTMSVAFGLGAAAPALSGVFAEGMFGRPSSTSVIAIPFGVMFGIAGAALGWAVGYAARSEVRQSRFAGAVDRRVVALVWLASVAVPSAYSISQVLTHESANAPRVIVSTGLVQRHDGASDLTPVTPATRVWDGFVDDEPPLFHSVRWNGPTIKVTREIGGLVVQAGALTSTAIDLSQFDYAREAHAVTARITGTEEWLAVLVRLRATGRRELFVVFDPRGKMVYEELLERRTGLRDDHVLFSAGPESAHQEFVVDLGAPVRFGSR